MSDERVLRVMVVDDERSMREFLEILLKREGYEVVTAPNGLRAVELFQEAPTDIVLTDLKMPGMTGIEVLEHVKKLRPSTEVIVFTAYQTVETAIEAMQKGAFHYVSKPFKNEELKLTLKKCIEKKLLFDENVELKREVAAGSSLTIDGFVFKSPKMENVFNLVQTVAPTRSSVLILGESGTGKEVIARAVHRLSKRRSDPFIPVDCGAIPENLLESELFGHVKGAFTGALTTKKGMFAVADGGTLFLDEVAELPLHLQVKLLRVLQERKIKPVGDVNEVSVDVRIVAATNRDIDRMVAEGKFREDLYYRLNVITVVVPPLRDRIDDVPHIAQHFLKKFAAEFGKPARSFAPDALRLLREYPYPGNVRELENIVEHAVTFSNAETVGRESLPERLLEKTGGPGGATAAPTAELTLPDTGFNVDDYLAGIEKRILVQALDKAGGSKTQAAKHLGITFRSMRYKLEKYGMD
jgi:two-component system response regulator PilR (NtrC family)